MTPSVFRGVAARDELGLVAELGLEAARERLKAHRDSFITEADFRFIKSQDVDFVRLPVGYWLFNGTDSYISGQQYVDKAFEWAKKHALKVIIDLHGLPGSQNGKHHSGQSGSIGFYQPANLQQSLELVEYIARRYGRQSALLGLEVINEPQAGLYSHRLLQYYDRAYKTADKLMSPEVKLIVSDAFMPRRMAWALSLRPKPRLVLDVHLYQVFGQQFADMNGQQHLDYVAVQAAMLTSLNRRLPILVGEWSAALPAGDHKKDHPNLQAAYLKRQLDSYDNNCWAHAYWSYKKQGQGAWSWRSMVKRGRL